MARTHLTLIAPNIWWPGSDLARYPQLFPSAFISATLGNYTIASTTDYYIQILNNNDFPEDDYRVTALRGVLVANGSSVHEQVGFFLDVVDDSGELLDSTALPTTPPHVTTTDLSFITLEKVPPDAGGPPEWYVIAHLDSLTIAANPIPEPASLAVWSMLAMVGIGFGWPRRWG